MHYEPPQLEIFLTRLAFLLYGRTVYKPFADRLPLRGGERVLDFGCGMGTLAFYAAKRLPRGRLTCLDISRRWLSACRKTLRRFDNVDFILWDFSALPQECCDAVYCHFVLHDIPKGELERILPMLALSLKPGGAFVFREPLREAEKLGVIKRLLEQNGLTLKSSRVTDIPVMGSVLESEYIML